MNTGVVWLRNTLRLNDNRVLIDSLKSTNCKKILPLYIINEEALYSENGINRIKFLFESLLDLKIRFETELKCKFLILNGNTSDIFRIIIEETDLNISEIFLDYSNEPASVLNEKKVREILSKHKSINFNIVPKVNTLTDIEQVVSKEKFRFPKSMKDMEKLFSEIFPKDEEGFYSLDDPMQIPNINKALPEKYYRQLDEYKFDIKNRLLDIGKKHISYFKGGESEGLIRLERKVSSKEEFVRNFRKPRTISTNKAENPLEPATTGLSPYLSFGCLSPRVLWKEVEKCYRNGEHAQPPESLHGQLLFREMFYILSKSVENWSFDSNNIMCKKIKWSNYEKDKIKKWEEGQTGFPYIDAMMRQLDSTGWMHHLGRHAVSCFLTRGQLWQHWKYGRDIFEKKLIDGDWALNNGNWLWLSGVAPFSMPYFRLYNPCPDAKSSLNVETKTADFIRYWVPELKEFPSKYIFEPHLAPIPIQESSNCIIGKDYPEPMVDRKVVAKENLAKFKENLADLN